jgi:hypothetical protein
MYPVRTARLVAESRMDAERELARLERRARATAVDQTPGRVDREPRIASIRRLLRRGRAVDTWTWPTTDPHQAQEGNGFPTSP